MKQLIPAVKRELMKLLSKKKYFVLLIIVAVIILGKMGIMALFNKVSGITFHITNNVALDSYQLVFEVILPLIAFMSITDLFASAVQEDTMKDDLVMPITRFGVMLSKVTAAMILLAVFAFVGLLSGTLVNILSGSFHIGYLLHSLAAYLIDMIPTIGVVLIGVLINMMTNSPTLAMLLSLVIYVAMKYLNYFHTIGTSLFTAYLGLHTMLIGAYIPFSVLLVRFGIILGSILVLFMVSYLLFDKKEF